VYIHVKQSTEALTTHEISSNISSLQFLFTGTEKHWHNLYNMGPCLEQWLLYQIYNVIQVHQLENKYSFNDLALGLMDISNSKFNDWHK